MAEETNKKGKERIKPERMDHLEKGAKLGKSKEKERQVDREEK